MQISNTDIAAVKLIEQFKHNDARGTFVKTFHQKDFIDNGITFQLAESFYSISHKNVLRGMHFHTAPYEHDKIVFCTNGAILDVALDIRPDSPTLGQYITSVLSFENNKALYIPKGFAHGFLTLTDEATTFYLVSGTYEPNHDKGILYNSFGMDWGNAPINTNNRDLSFPTLKEYMNG
jgi:dTDP-4-dehydrorhamnose 3,5-epimerase